MRDCLNDTELHQLLDDVASDAERAPLEEHLASCESCQQRLERLAAGNEDWPVVTDLAPNPYDLEPALQRVISEARSRHADLETGPDTLVDDELIREFLDPAEQPECLGRLAHYDVLEVLGRGGMGIVLRAFDRKLQREVAIKVMAPLLAASPRANQWFQREAQSAAALDHDHVVTIHSVEEAHGLPFIVMQYVEGESLQQRLDRQGPLDLNEALRIAGETALGLAAAHAHGLIHRDIKPANILLEAGSDRAKIADFGLARAVDSGGTGTGIVAGTPHYMAPEQAVGGTVDHRADLYALGGVLYAMGTGQRPDGEASGNSARCLPDWLLAIIARLRAAKPEDRFQSAAELAEVLAKRLSQLEQDVQGGEVAPIARPGRRPTRRAVLMGLSAAAVVLAAVWIAIWMWREPDVDPPLAPNEVRRFMGHNMWLACLAVSPDGRRAVSGGADKSVRLWNVETGKQLELLKGHKGLVISVAFSPDGRRAVSSGTNDKTLILWDLDRGREIRRMEYRDGILGVAFSSDGAHVVSGSNNKLVTLWDVETGENVFSFRGHKGLVHCVAVSPDGRYAASGGLDDSHNRASAIHLWDIRARRPLRQLTGHQDIIASVAFSSDGRRLLSTCADNTMRVWETETGQELHRCEHPHRVEGTAFLSDRHAVSACWDKLVRVWDLKTGEEVARFSGHTGPVHAIAALPDGRHVLSAGDKTLRLWTLPAR